MTRRWLTKYSLYCIMWSHILFFYIFLVCPIWLPLFLLFLCVYVIASIAYIHPVYGAGVRTHNLLIMKLDQGTRLITDNVRINAYLSINQLACSIENKIQLMLSLAYVTLSTLLTLGKIQLYWKPPNVITVNLISFLLSQSDHI
jgi:hypothetical protein